MVNADIRIKLFESELPHWRVAKRLGIDASTFSRKLREELPDEEKAKIIRIIEEEANQNDESSSCS